MSVSPSEIQGIGAAPGIVIGKVFLLDRRSVIIPHVHLDDSQIEAEIQRFHIALEQSQGQLKEIGNKVTLDGQEHAAILQAHEMMLQDPTLVQQTCHRIRTDQVNAEWAVQQTLKELGELLEKVENGYLRERRTDLDFVGQRIIRNLTGTETAWTRDLNHSDPVVLVAHDLSPADTVGLSDKSISAFATEVGSRTSHTSIVARSMDVPAVVGCEALYQRAGHNDTIIVDGLSGTVTLHPNENQIAVARAKQQRFDAFADILKEQAFGVAKTKDDQEILVFGNIETPNEAKNVMSRGGNGIGLYRSEFLFVGRSGLPTEDEHYETYASIFDSIGERPVTIRTFDLGGDKLFGSAKEAPESNPALGLRGLRFCLNHGDIFIPQLKGLLRAGTKGNLKILFPMVTEVTELMAAKAYLNLAKEQLKNEGKAFKSEVPIGCMVEVPSMVFSLQEFLSRADFLSVGTNDLMQYLLALDRTNERVAHLYQPLHSGVLHTLNTIAKVASQHNTPLTICGELAGEVEFAPILLGLGYTHLSMNASTIPWVKAAVSKLDRQRCSDLVAELLKTDRMEERAAKLIAFCEEHFPQDLLELGQHIV
ncbi:MAG: phosphoenolpyruvate--protein phosphotransferase [Myxococcota bacterium]|nr:phosphoenolpyruvate--protein phosphotransferase [Myxococcota bacterium]